MTKRCFGEEVNRNILSVENAISDTKNFRCSPEFEHLAEPLPYSSLKVKTIILFGIVHTIILRKMVILKILQTRLKHLIFRH